MRRRSRRESLLIYFGVASPTTRDGCCRAVTRAVCPPLTIVEPGSHPPNCSISFHLVNSWRAPRVLALLSVFLSPLENHLCSSLGIQPCGSDSYREAAHGQQTPLER